MASPFNGRLSNDVVGDPVTAGLLPVFDNDNGELLLLPSDSYSCNFPIFLAMLLFVFDDVYFFGKMCLILISILVLVLV